MNTRIIIDKTVTIGKIEKEVFGSFVEHLGRCVYNGIYEPTHESADKNGFRNDVKEALKDLNVPVLRYPGGNFVSGHDWKDSIGKNRKEVLDLAWKALEPNTVGIDEFFNYAEEVNSQVMMAVNLGTGTIKDAQEIVEYCNMEKDGYFAKLRIANGRTKPYNIKYWCLGNEMDGQWQIGTKTAEEYGKIAMEAAKVMKWVDPSIKLIACGSSTATCPTFPTWDRVVLEQTYDYIDYLSLHSYYTYPTEDHNLEEFFASSTGLDSYIKVIKATCQYVKALKRSKKDIYLSFDEWNVWHTFDNSNVVNEPWKVGMPLLENHYDFADAIVVSTLLSSLMNNADIIKMACFAQLVNVIAPIITKVGGGLLKQTIYYPISLISSNFANTIALNPFIDTEYYESKTYGKTPYIKTTISYDKENHSYILLLVNTANKVKNVNLVFHEYVKLSKNYIIHSDDVHVKNTFEDPNKINIEEVSINNSKKCKSANIKLQKYSINLLIFAEEK